MWPKFPMDSSDLCWTKPPPHSPTWEFAFDLPKLPWLGECATSIQKSKMNTSWRTWRRKQRSICRRPTNKQTNKRHCQRQFKSLKKANEHELNTKRWQRHCQCQFESSKKCKWTCEFLLRGGMYLVEVWFPEDLDFAGGWYYAPLLPLCLKFQVIHF